MVNCILTTFEISRGLNWQIFFLSNQECSESYEKIFFVYQGVITFYTAEIFKEAESAVDPNDCALVIGVTYFLSSILGLVLKKHVGRRFLLLASELGMAISQLAMGIYFYVLASKFHYYT